MADLFKVIDSVFNDGILETLSDKDLGACAYNIQRLMSIEYPIQAAKMNLNGTISANVVKSWHYMLKGRYTMTPSWTKTPTAKARLAYQKQHKQIKLPERKLIHQFMNHHKMDSKEMDFLFDTNPIDVIKEIKELNRAIND